MESSLRTYLLNTSFHGIRYLAERDRHWTERVFWLVCCVLSWFASGLLMKASWYDFQNNALSFVVETSYLDWDTRFPSVAICETDNQQRIADVTDQLYGDPHDYNLDELVKELVFFRGLSYYTLQLCGPNSVPNAQCITKNFSMYESLVRSPCKELLRTCKWNNEEFDCCKYFTQVDTELGICYGINTYQAREPKTPRLRMVSNLHTGPGTLYMELYGFSNIYILSEQDVPSLTSLQSDVLQISPHIHYHRFLAIKEIENQPEVKDVSIQQRNCRYADESNLDVYNYYSYSACNVQCRKDAQISICNCTHHFMPNTPFPVQCDISGLECLNKHYNDLAVLKAHWANRSGLVCFCIPSCTEIEMSVIRDDKIGGYENERHLLKGSESSILTPDQFSKFCRIHEDFAIVELSLERLPTERFKRNVVRGKLDLVVSMGGSAGLFVGASILSFVEILYYFSLRAGNTYLQRMYKEEKKKSKKKEQEEQRQQQNMRGRYK